MKITNFDDETRQPAVEPREQPAHDAASLPGWPAISLWNWRPFLEGLEPPRFAGPRRYVIGVEGRRYDRVRRYRWQLDAAEPSALRQRRLRRKLARAMRRISAPPQL